MTPAPVRTNEVGDVVLESARQLQALADPDDEPTDACPVRVLASFLPGRA